MDIETLLNKFGPNFVEPHKLTESERKELRKKIEPIWDRYINLPLTLSINDEPIKRLCQVLTNNGYITFSSCQGHGKDEPHIYFRCKKTSRVAELSHAVGSTAITNFLWEIGVWGQQDSRNRYRIFYMLRPEEPRRENLDIIKDEKQLVEDFDILGYSILDYFNHQN
ncbi:MAG: hypothetical protein ABIE36_03130 [Candidatus Diapherotrites archaeon]